MTLVVQTNLERDLFHAEKTRFQQDLRAFHPQQSQVPHRRHAHVGFENVAQTPDRKVYGLRELRERQLTADIVAHHLDDFFYSFIQAHTLGEMFIQVDS